MVNKKLKLAILRKFDCQADFAEALDVQQSKVSEVVRGRRRLTEQEKAKWAGVLDVPLKEAFGD